MMHGPGVEVRARYVLGKHAGPVMALAYHPNGSSVTSVGEDGSVYLWNFSARRETLFGDRPGRVSAVAYSPDGRYLAAGLVGADGSTVVLHDLETREPRLDLSAADAWITALAYSPDGVWIAAGCKDGTVKAWHVERLLTSNPDRATISHESASLNAGEDIVTSVAFDPRGARLTAGTLDPSLRTWHPETEQIVNLPLPTPLGPVRAAAYDPSGLWMAAGADDGSLYVWDVAAERPPVTIPTPGGDAIQAVVFSPDGTLLLAGGSGEAIWVYDAATSEGRGPLAPDSGRVRSLAIRPDGTNLVSGHLDGTVRFWELAATGSDAAHSG
jgi:WD40 repeat protein